MANPEGFTGDSIFWFGYQVASGHANKVTQLMEQVTPPPTVSRSVESFTNISMNDATLSEDAAQTFFHGVEAVISGNTRPAGFTQSSDTSDICHNLRIVNISDGEGDGQLLSAKPLDIVVAGSPTDFTDSGIHYGTVTDTPVCNLNYSNHYLSLDLVQTSPNNGALLANATRQVFGQIILETALHGGQISAQKALINIVHTVERNPSGSLSKAIFHIASIEASGNIATANGAVKAVASHLACAGDVMKIPELVDRILSPTRSSVLPSVCTIAGPVVPNPKDIRLDQNIGVTVSDEMNESNKISGANVNVNIEGPDFKKTFSGVSDNGGVIRPPFELQISENAIPGLYKVTADAGTTGYNKGSATTTFTVVPKPPPHALSVAIRLKYSTMPPGPTQNIGVTVSDEMNESNKISGANVNVNIEGPDFKKTLSGVTDNGGVIRPPFELQISENAIPGLYKVTADAGTTGYNK